MLVGRAFVIVMMCKQSVLFATTNGYFVPDISMTMLDLAEAEREGGIANAAMTLAQVIARQPSAMTYPASFASIASHLPLLHVMCW